MEIVCIGNFYSSLLNLIIKNQHILVSVCLRFLVISSYCILQRYWSMIHWKKFKRQQPCATENLKEPVLHTWNAGVSRPGVSEMGKHDDRFPWTCSIQLKARCTRCPMTQPWGQGCLLSYTRELV